MCRKLGMVMTVSSLRVKPQRPYPVRPNCSRSLHSWGRQIP